MADPTDNPYDPPSDVAMPHAEAAVASMPPPGQWMGHPTGLFYLFFAELWERFSFYGMRALLVLYCTQELFAGEADPKAFAYEIYAAYGALVYFTPAIGGVLADRVIGHKNSIMLGAVLMTLGHFTMAFESQQIFYLSLGLLIIGNGFFKPNISSLVGGLYGEGDTRRDAGFTIFYLGINVGAFLAPLLCGWLGESFGWHYGFGLAGIGMLAGLIVFGYGRSVGIYGGQGEQPPSTQEQFIAGINVRYWIYGAAFLAAPVFAFLVQQNSLNLLAGISGAPEFPLLGVLLWGLLLVVLGWIIVQIITSDRVTRGRLAVIVVLTVLSTVFWAFFEQAGSSLTLFAKERVNLKLLTASMTNAINPFYIMILAIPFSIMWQRLGNRSPRTIVKFSLGIWQLGLGFLVFAVSSRFMDDGDRVSMIFLLVGYLLITSGELFLSPIGLSKVTELSPARLVAFMMGVWFLSSSFAHWIAGIIAKLTTGGGSDGAFANLATGIIGRDVSQTYGEGALQLFNYTSVFAQIAIVSFIVGLIALLISPIVNRLSHGVH